MNKYVVHCLFSLLFCICINLEAQAASIALSTCSQTDVNSAISSSSDGDVLICPSGSWSWSKVVINNKNITLQGAGIGSTVISITAAGGLEAPQSNTKAFRITGFTFKSTASFGINNGWAMMRIYGGHDWRIDNNEFQIYSDDNGWPGGNGIFIRYNTAGLIDHNRFVEGSGQAHLHAAVMPYNSGSTASSGEYSWSNFGSNTISRAEHTVFIEDNYFHTSKAPNGHPSHACYGQMGGVYVFRHNQVHNMNVDNHGFCSTHAGREWEISNNAWIQDASWGLYSMIHLRGGTGVIYNNTATGDINYGIQWNDYRVTNSCSGSVTSYVPGYGTVSPSSSCSSTEGWPCAEQIGRGQNNSSDPIYVWGNTNFPSSLQSVSTTYVQQGRDYFLNSGPKPGYTAYPYPHPLSSGQAPPPSVPTPNPPTNIQIN